jgi:mannosyltransferase OCH1-like enzyme
MTLFMTTKANLVRLALIYKHGGVYLDASTIAV